MKIALTIAVREGEESGLDEFLRFHRAAGVDVVVCGRAASATVAAALERYTREGFVTRVDGDASPTELARLAVDEFGADWLIPSTPEEFWWPRGQSLKDVLAVIPPRYGVVQCLVRTFLAAREPSEGGSRSPLEARTVRTSLLGPDGSGGASLEELLRPVYRAGPNMRLDPEDWTLGGRRVPLRAWYPIEVFRFPPGLPQLGDTQLEAQLADGSLVTDTRLRDALQAGAEASFAVPSIVDDASYAVECAAVGEVDLVELDRQIRALELRIAELEARFWPTVRRTLKRLARRPS